MDHLDVHGLETETGMKMALLTRYDRLGASSRVRMLQQVPYLQDAGIEPVAFPLFENAYLTRLYAGKPTAMAMARALMRRLADLRRLSGIDLLWIEKELMPWLPFAFERRLMPRTVPYALDFDDVALSGHPSTVLVPAIMAESYILQSSGKEALLAYVVGYEVWAELISRESDQYHLKGWHPTGVLGAVATAAAAAYLHKLNAEQAGRAMAIAASMSSGLVANFGTMTKPFHAGRAASHGLEAVRLAKLGLTSSPDAFEHHAGYLAALSPAGVVSGASGGKGGGAMRTVKVFQSTQTWHTRWAPFHEVHEPREGQLPIEKITVPGI
mgnify:CR=1 FL=1